MQAHHTYTRTVKRKTHRKAHSKDHCNRKTPSTLFLPNFFRRTIKQINTHTCTHSHTQIGSSSELVIFSRRYKSFSSSVVNWAFSECWPVCHCMHRLFVHSERRNKISRDYPLGENPQEVSRSARVQFSFVSRCQGGRHHLEWVR